MQICNYCNSTILFGGIEKDNLMYCNENCYKKSHSSPAFHKISKDADCNRVHNNIKTPGRLDVIHRPALYPSFRDTIINLVTILVVINIRMLIDGSELIVPKTPHGFLILFIIFFVTWMATYVACKLGATTFTDDWYDPSKYWYRGIPGTLAVGMITMLLTFLILVFIDQLHA